MEIVTVIVLITSLVVAFSGAFLGLAANALKKPVDQLVRRVEQNLDRIATLEKYDAVREAQFHNLMKALEEFQELLENYRTRRGE